MQSADTAALQRRRYGKSHVVLLLNFPRFFFVNFVGDPLVTF